MDQEGLKVTQNTVLMTDKMLVLPVEDGENKEIKYQIGDISENNEGLKEVVKGDNHFLCTMNSEGKLFWTEERLSQSEAQELSKEQVLCMMESMGGKEDSLFLTGIDQSAIDETYRLMEKAGYKGNLIAKVVEIGS